MAQCICTEGAQFLDADSSILPSFLLAERSVPRGYTYCGDIASGCFGEVAVAKTSGGAFVAVKKTWTAADYPPQRCAPDCAGEADALRAAAHENVVPLLDAIADGGETFLVLELCSTDLEKVLSRCPRPLAEAEAKALLQDLLSGLDACHCAGLLHRDVKPANLLLSSHGILKLADFGLARWQDPKVAYSPAVASRWYRAPELLYGSQHYGPAVDIWAAGCVFAELLGKAPIFAGSSDIEQLSRIRSVMGSIDTTDWRSAPALPDFCKLLFAPCQARPWSSVLPHASQAAVDVLAHMLVYNPDHRSSARDLLRHTWFSTPPLPASREQLSRHMHGQPWCRQA